MNKTQYFFAQVKAVNEQDRTLDAVASTRDLDRDKDIIEPSAFVESLDSFKANPVILAIHQHRLSTGSSPVIGSAIPDSIKITDNEVLFTMTFATTALGEEYWQLYRDKHMRAFSIGFIPIEYEDKKDESLGWVRTFTKIELLEISAVPVPSNRSALARAKGYFENQDTKELITTALHESEEHVQRHLNGCLVELSARIEEQFDDIKTLLIADPGGLAETLLGASAESPVPAGEEKTAERLIVKCNELSENNV